MKRTINKHLVFWNAAANEGQITLELAGDEEPRTAAIHLDSPQEGTLLLDILRNESSVYYDDEYQLIITGMEPVGEGEKS